MQDVSHFLELDWGIWSDTTRWIRGSNPWHPQTSNGSVGHFTEEKSCSIPNLISFPTSKIKMFTDFPLEYGMIMYDRFLTHLQMRMWPTKMLMDGESIQLSPPKEWNFTNRSEDLRHIIHVMPSSCFRFRHLGVQCLLWLSCGGSLDSRHP